MAYDKTIDILRDKRAGQVQRTEWLLHRIAEEEDVLAKFQADLAETRETIAELDLALKALSA